MTINTAEIEARLADKVSIAPEDVERLAKFIDFVSSTDCAPIPSERQYVDLTDHTVATLRALSAERDRLREALEAVDSEILLDGHLQELVSTALDMSDDNMGSSATTHPAAQAKDTAGERCVRCGGHLDANATCRLVWSGNPPEPDHDAWECAKCTANALVIRPDKLAKLAIENYAIRTQR